MNNELVSVIIPVFNAEKEIERCCSSIINQTYSNLEIIIINDGSVDNSLNILKKLAKDEPRIKIINKKNTGVSDTRNKGLKIAKGKYLLFVDADDYIDSNTIFYLYEKIKEKNTDIIRYNGYIEGKKKKFSKLEFPIENNLLLESKRDNNKIIELLNHPTKSLRCYSPLLFMKNKNIIPFHTELNCLEDKVFYTENFLNNKKILFLNKCFYYYTFNPNSKTKNIKNFSKNINDIIEAKIYLDKKIEKYDYNIKLINDTYINLILYRLDYLVDNTDYNQFRKIYLDILTNKKLKEILLNKLDNSNLLKKIQLFLLHHKKYKNYYYLTKIKNKMKG